MLDIKKDQFPLIKFDTVARENRNKSIEAGRLVHDDVDVVYIKQIGEKDENERVATEWLEQLRAQSMGGNGQNPRVSVEWYEFAKKRYDNYKAGLANRPDGFLVKEWPILTPSQVKNLHAMETFTVEEIAAWTEQGMGMYGMGGRELREKAKLWLASGDAKAEQIGALQAESKSKDEQIKKQGDLIAQLSERLAALEEDRPKRGRKEAAEA